MADHLKLLNRADGDTPGAVLELALEELRAHGRLAMRRNDGARARQETAHPVAIMRQRPLAEYGKRQREVLSQQVPALPADFCKRDGRHAAGHALDAVVNEVGFNLREVKHGMAAPGGVDHVTLQRSTIAGSRAMLGVSMIALLILGSV